ncbi:MAG TPA: Tm-1-like ATP-binding domain-containing protein [Hypericibacter adhaerens]|uniref:ABC transporter domain-containing protein n=1 Tax=Hypericibacter adhaerens TaxID=2602016 RepID=A0A5J6MVD3_9PROT|nr:Tm-1-like ATP-binding domain-containing protein [Hypericibacter adhaerens]QEX21154.1 hypothetical protein FRZ61_10750 [Hypericibacter adhaerens]HWA42285.1 Tm-1-like ATP-binding domain-containing protein [Hypericibacter adhaerens]
MADRPLPAGTAAPILQVSGLNVHYGQSHALQGVNLSLRSGVLAVVGRNGMGKTTLCKAIMGIVKTTSGSVRFAGEELIGQSAAQIARKGIGYVPQGRRLWPSLTVDEHLRLSKVAKPQAWSIERIYDTFPRLAERRQHGGAQLSGGEQQMLAISRALLLNPRLLVMDEPTEGLAPVIVQQVRDMLIGLARQGEISVLLIEQNIGIATAVSERVAIMVNGRINRIVDAKALAADRLLQQRLLGVGQHAHDEDLAPEPETEPAGAPLEAEAVPPATALPERRDKRRAGPAAKAGPSIPASAPGSARLMELRRPAAGSENVILAGALDRHEAALRHLREILRDQGIQVRLADLSARGRAFACDVTANQIAIHHPRGSAAVFVADEAQAADAMAEAFRVWLQTQQGIAGVIVAGGHAVAGIATEGMRALPIGLPKLLITSAAPDSLADSGATDVTLLHSVAHLDSVNAVTRDVLGNGARAFAGMVKGRKAGGAARPEARRPPPAIGLTLTPTTRAGADRVRRQLEPDHDSVLFDAMGGGGRAMARLAEEGRLAGLLDIATGDVAPLVAGGEEREIEDRFRSLARSGLPYVGSCGGLDAAAFGAIDSVPTRFRHRNLHRLAPGLSLMRLNAADGAVLGCWIGERLNRMTGPMLFLLPEGGLSALDAPGQPFHDPEADRALFAAIESTVHPGSDRQVRRLPYHINEAGFAAAAVEAFTAIEGRRTATRRAVG